MIVFQPVAFVDHERDSGLIFVHKQAEVVFSDLNTVKVFSMAHSHNIKFKTNTI